MTPLNLQPLRQFRQEVYQIFSPGQDAAFEIMDAITDSPHARSVVEVSLAPGMQRQFSSVYKGLERARIDRRALTRLLVRLAEDQVERYNELIAAGRRGDAVEYFMAKVVRLPAEFVAEARTQPWWPAQEALAHTLAYDATIMGDFSLPTERAASVKAPTLVIAGGADFPWMRDTAQALADALSDGQTRTLEGQGHNVDPAVLAPVLVEFFAG